jgi:hypothetical protein
VTKEKILVCIGLNGFEKARIRLLLAEASTRLSSAWRLDDETSRADLLIVAPQSMEGEAAALRARGRGVRCVNLGGTGNVGEDYMPTGFEVDDLVRVLESADALSGDEFKNYSSGSMDFYDVSTSGGAVREDALGVSEAEDLERFLRRNSGEYSVDSIVPFSLEGTSVVPPRGPFASKRAQTRSDERTPFAQSDSSVPGVIDTRSVASRTATDPRFHQAGAGKLLSEFLKSGNLMAPCQLVREGTEPLILDPKNRIYIICGDLKAAEPYVTEHFRASDFERLTTRDMERWRGLCPPMPYVRLEWLSALRNGDGWLPQHLDPGGSYRVRDMLDLDEHFDPQIRINQTLLEWKRLHEITAQAAVEMQVVFDTVAAFDAIGWLEWRPRERLR